MGKREAPPLHRNGRKLYSGAVVFGPSRRSYRYSTVTLYRRRLDSLFVGRRIAVGDIFREARSNETLARPVELCVGCSARDRRSPELRPPVSAFASVRPKTV